MILVDICIYEQEWIPPTEEDWKGTIVMRAVVTGVHKGDVPIGTKLQYEHYVEDSPKLFGHFRSVVEGELMVFFFSRKDSTLKDGKYTIEGDGHYGFNKLDDKAGSGYIEAFQKELKTNPELQPKGDTDPKIIK